MVCITYKSSFILYPVIRAGKSKMHILKSKYDNYMFLNAFSFRHCEEHSDKAIQNISRIDITGLLRHYGIIKGLYLNFLAMTSL